MVNYSNVSVYFDRFLESDIVEFLNKDTDVVFVDGCGGCGKSVLLKNLEGFFSSCFFIDFEDVVKEQVENVDFCRLVPKDTEFVLVDNFYVGEHYLNSIDECIVKRKIKFVIALKKPNLNVRLKSNFKKLFLPPLNFGEYLKSCNELLYSELYSNIRDKYYSYLSGRTKFIHLHTDSIREILPVFDEFLCYGGYPKVVFSMGIDEKKKALNDVVTKILYRVFELLGGRFEFEFLRNVFVYLAHKCGSFFKVTDFMEEFGLSFYMAKSVLNAFCLAKGVVLVGPYWKEASSEYSKVIKVYFLDNGVRNCIIGDYNNWRKRWDRDVIFSVFFVGQTMWNGSDLLYWKTKMGAYVDFIQWIDNRMCAFSIKSNVRKNRVGKSVISFYKKYNPFRMIVLNYDFFGSYSNNKGYDIIFFPFAFI